MRNILIAMYKKNAEEAAKVCRNHDIFAFIDEESLDDYAAKLKKAIKEDSYILTDEEGGAPFLAALIASANTGSRIVCGVGRENIVNIIDAVSEDGKLPAVINENQIINALRTDL
ncbi:MAG: hypothetical protein IJF87_04070 [Erysipelotrichaceae bacterium]|nr:hypothetical protein [Erysipelotrichaceae bacterium]